MRKKKGYWTLMGALLFFITITVVVMVAVICFGAIDGATGGNRKVIAWAMIGVILFLAAVCTIADVIRRKLLVEKPVNKILQATDAVAAGDFTTKLEITHNYRHYDEYDYIMENLNKMTAELSKNEVLKSDFISNVSHEMKTPLAIINNYAKALQSDDLDDATRKEYAKTLSDTAKRLSNLVMNILRLNKLENQEITSGKKKIKLDEMLAECVIGFEDIIESKHINLGCDFDDVTVKSVKDYLELVWNNLLSNAIKFTPEYGSINISLKSINGKAVVKVTDTGCGISPEVGARIFDKFYQGDTSHAKEGNGLGLALVKKVIDILGGEISVESEVGKGSTFTVVI
jgi:signal transduction histidine kinase